MPVIPQVILELRALFREGATPSRLIQHIYARHGGGESRPVLVEQYFAKAFFVWMVRIPDGWDEFCSGDLRHAQLNTAVLHQIVVNRPRWDQEVGPVPDSWLDSLVATDDLQAMQQIDPMAHPELAQAWPQLDSEGKKYLQRVLGQATTLHEQVAILARLAERLQQRLVALEQTLADTQTPGED